MHSNRGFTLIEVLIVVAIIGILSAIAIPNYSDYVTRSRIPEATSGLANLRVKMEQLFQDCRDYQGTVNCPQPAVPAPNDFTFVINAPDSTHYTITATGQNAMAGFVYTVDELNVRKTTSAHSGWATSATCWVTTKSGPC